MKKIVNYSEAIDYLSQNSLSWLVTGGAGFIGSNLAETLLRCNQKVRVVDNFITGYQKNIDELEKVARKCSKSHFEFIQGDVRDNSSCENWIKNMDKVMHQAALGSVPRSIDDPTNSHDHNVNGFFHILNACRIHNVDMVYASSSAVYGNSKKLPKVEDETGRPLSPYAVTKSINELYAEVFSYTYRQPVVGLRYFNVFGPRQDPNGPYAAVIPRWIQIFLQGGQPEIYGDGETSRDFCFVDNAVQANIMAALNIKHIEPGRVFNVACEKQTTLNQLFQFIQESVKAEDTRYRPVTPLYRDFRSGDVRHSLANIQSAHDLIGYSPQLGVDEGLKKSIHWYIENPRYVLN